MTTVRRYKRGPNKTHQLICPDCGFVITYGPSKTTSTRRTSKKRSQRAKKAKRDELGRFLPAKKKTTATKRKTRTVPAFRRQKISRF